MIADQKDFCGPLSERRIKGYICAAIYLYGARSRGRTGTMFPSTDFKSVVSTNFTIRAVAL